MWLDFRHVTDRDPYIGNGFMDYMSIGEFLMDDKGCPDDMIVDNNIHFYDIHDQSQLVIGESAATCILYQWSKSPLGRFHMNEEKFNSMFNVEGYSFNTSSLAPHIKLFEEKVGKGKPLKVDFGF